ncbi:MAG: FAD binding domain-containing protein, partial [Dehalococcoidia bacterium]
MRLPTFRLYEPESLWEAISLLDEFGDDARAIGGGTALVPMMRFGLLRPSHIVSLQRISGLRDVSKTDGELRIGALTTLHEVATSQVVQSDCPLLASAAGSVATPAIRNTGTLGGNLCYAESASDPAPALLALVASVNL